ncbi:STAS domain-containing protein [Modestobacter sp. NPDC049651]|uniref:STAS domain-containing protein n=1 Tax=unclassified Modestobacter TaxID=2643866 RepID=UPI0033C8FBE0
MSTSTLPGRIDLVEEDGVAVLRLHGEIDTLVVDAWDDARGTADDARTADAVDLSAATFLDCRGLRLIVRQTDQVRRDGRVPELRRPSRMVRRMLEVAGAAPLFAAIC